MIDALVKFIGRSGGKEVVLNATSSVTETGHVFFADLFSSLVFDHDVKQDGTSRVTLHLEQGTTSFEFYSSRG